MDSFEDKDDLFLLTLTKSIDELEQVLPEGSVDCIITSPPYIYAQEYFRSTKIDLYWLNLADDESIRKLTKEEIGQKSQSFYLDDMLSEIQTYSYDFEIIKELAQRFKTKENVSRFAAYFGDMLYFIQLSAKLLSKKGTLAVFVGEPKVFGHHVRVKDILVEMMAQNNFNIQSALFDSIKGRHLSKNRLNVNPSGIPGEWLIIGEKL
jgi:methylase of polypeptide subunit release factors